MYIYHYSKDTGEYLYKSIAESDPAATFTSGEFTPLVPAYATLLVPPSAGENQAAVFTDGAWVRVSDFRKNYKKCDDELTISDITELGELTDGYLVDNSTAELIKANPDSYKIENWAVVLKTDDDLAQERKEEFETDFFSTSLGYIRRNVTMADGSSKNFLTDLLIPIKTGLELGVEVEVITYNEPDYYQEFTEDYAVTLQEKKTATAAFIQECLQILVTDFTGG